MPFTLKTKIPTSIIMEWLFPHMMLTMIDQLPVVLCCMEVRPINTRRIQWLTVFYACNVRTMHAIFSGGSREHDGRSPLSFHFFSCKTYANNRLTPPLSVWRPSLGNPRCVFVLIQEYKHRFFITFYFKQPNQMIIPETLEMLRCQIYSRTFVY